MGFILGQERILHLKENGTSTWFPIACLVSNEITQNTDFLDTTTRENQGHRTSVPADQDYELSFNAILPDDDDTVGKLGLKQLREFKLNQTYLDWKLEALFKNFTDVGTCYISSLSEPAAVDGFIEFSGSLRGYGKITSVDDIVDLEPPTRPVLSLILDTNTPSVGLSWTVSTDNTQLASYELRIINDGNENIFNVGLTNTYNDSAVAQGEYYSYLVRAYDIYGNVSAWSSKRLAYIPIPTNPPDQTTAFLFQDGNKQQFQDSELKIFQD